MSSIAVLQSNYLPWKGYFDLIAVVDLFVLYDTVQYTKNDWRNRNRIKAPGGGTTWITVPVHHRSLDQAIDQTAIADTDAPRRHWRTIEQVYRSAPTFPHVAPVLQDLLDRPAPAMLTTLNERLIRGCCDILGITTPIVQSHQFELGGDATERLVDLCRHTGATTYRSGPAAKAYLDVDLMAAAGVEVVWMDYSGYPVYDQVQPPFDHHVSIVDLLACTGTAAADAMLHVATPTPR